MIPPSVNDLAPGRLLEVFAALKIHENVRMLAAGGDLSPELSFTRSSRCDACIQSGVCGTWAR
jgi:hypothetical protein